MGRRQCEEEGCSKWGIGDTGFCKTRGGGKRFQHAGCLKSAVSGGTPHCKAHGAAGAASTRAASRQLLQAARSTARRMAGASDAKRRAAPSPLKATQLLVSRMAGAGAASTRATSRRLEAIRSIVSRMAVASAAKRRAAPSRLEATRIASRRHATLCLAWRGPAMPTRGLCQGSCYRRHATLVMNLQSSILMAQTTDPSTRYTARRMAGAGGVSRRAAPSQSLELPAVCTARFVSSATMRRTMHRNSVAGPRRPKPRVGSRGVDARAPPPAAGGECGATHRLATGS
jgi:hypothetical protein